MAAELMHDLYVMWFECNWKKGLGIGRPASNLASVKQLIPTKHY